MSPTDQRSDLAVYFMCERIWGDIYNGVPTTELRIVLAPRSRLRAKPKSLILQTPFLSNIFAGLRSL
jgi:hypothetical protein